MIEVRNVSKQVVTTEGTLRILDQINLSVADGETISEDGVKTIFTSTSDVLKLL